MFYNQLKTVLLLVGLSAVFITLGGLIAGHAGIMTAFIGALLMNGITYFFSDKIVLWLYGAKPLHQSDHADIYMTVQELADACSYLCQNCGWLKLRWQMHLLLVEIRNASVAFTTGILDILDHDELRAVIAHELSHIKNRDILVATIAATLAAAISSLARILRSGHSKGSAANRVTAFILFSIIVPLAALLMQLAISRSREYLADETGAHACGTPLALASALEKLHMHSSGTAMDNADIHKASTASLFIMHPFAGSQWLSLFSTHPPIHARVARLRTMCNKMF